MADNVGRREMLPVGEVEMKRWGWAGPAAVLAFVLLAALGAWTFASRSARDDQAAIGGPFELVDQTGAKVDQDLLRGKLSAVFFGYTYCPDVCPTTLTALGAATAALGRDADRFQVIFITVDPERDTPKALASYLQTPSFPRGVKGLTGSPEQIARVAKAYHVYYQKAPQGGTYTMDHSAVVYLMDARGRFVRPLDVSTPPAEIARQIRSALSGT